MKTLFGILLFAIIPMISFAQSSNPDGLWTPDNDTFIGKIRIRNIADNKYKIKCESILGDKVGEANYNDDNGIMRTKIYWCPGDDDDYYIYNPSKYAPSHYNDVKVPASEYYEFRFVIKGNQMAVYYQQIREYYYKGKYVHGKRFDEWGPIYYTRW